VATVVAEAIGNSGLSASQTYSQSSAFLAGDRIVAVGLATRDDSHSQGLGALFDIDDNASTNTITWTKVVATSINTAAGASFASQLAVWVSSVLTDNETIQVTIDGRNNGTNQFYYALSLTAWTGTGFDGTVVQSATNTSGGEPITVTFSGAPSAHQMIIGAWVCDAGLSSWDANPSGFADVHDNDSVGSPMKVLESTTNTATGVTIGFSGGGTKYSGQIIGIEWTEGGGADLTQDETESLGVTDAVTAVMDLVGGEAESVGLSDSAAVVIGGIVDESDPVGVTDAVAVAMGLGAVEAESFGLTGSVTAAMGGVVSAAELLGVTDAVAVALDQAAVVAESVGLTDAVTITMGLAVALADNVGMSDVADAQTSAAPTVDEADLLGVTDAVTVSVGHQAVIADLLDCADAAGVSLGLQVIAAESMGMTDQAAVAMALFVALADTIGAVDAATVTIPFVGVLIAVRNRVARSELANRAGRSELANRVHNVRSGTDS
jgi:hypothetical protein